MSLSKIEHQRRIDLKQCIHCKADVTNGKTCNNCLIKRRHLYSTKYRKTATASDKARKKRLIAKGLCGKCGKRPLFVANYCKICRDIINNTTTKLRLARATASLCRCGEPRLENRTHCQTCTDRNRATDNERKQRWEKAGLCVKCGETRHTKVLCKTCGEKAKRRGIRLRAHYKKLVINHYGGRCACKNCPEHIKPHFQFLTIDHVDGGGNQHRRDLFGGHLKAGSTFYYWLHSNNYPDNVKLRVLCWNCNCTIGAFGKCPHEDDTFQTPHKVNSAQDVMSQHQLHPSVQQETP